MNNQINSKEYWENRFITQDWQQNCGQQQTQYFAEQFLQNLPKPMFNLLREQTSLCDWGCAEGQAVYELKKNFPNLNISGIDISESAVQTAIKMYDNCEFAAIDLFSTKKSYDVIFTSNVLEHFEDPFEIVKKLLQHTKKMLIILVPFQEYNRIDEHFYTFDYENVPQMLGDFKLGCYKTFECKPVDGISYWAGYQIILTYFESNFYSLINPSMELLSYGDRENINNIKLLAENNINILTLNNQTALKDSELKELKSQIEFKDSELKELRKQIEFKDEQLALKNSLLNDLLNSSSWKLTKPIRMLNSFIQKIRL